MNDFGILSLIPTIITIATALITKRVVLALFLGIVSGSFIIGQGFISGFISLWHYMYITFTSVERLQIALFLLLVGGLLRTISDSGAYMEFAKKLSRYLNTARKIRLTTFFLGILIFFDDYANVLISGASMRSLSEEKKISPALMAYIVDSVATVVSIMLLSTWSVFEGSLMVSGGETVGIKKTATEFLLSSLPYHLCTYAALYLALLVAFSGKWFGTKMDRDVKEDIKEDEITGKGAKFRHVFIPIMILIITALGGLFYSGYKKFLEIRELNLISLLADAPVIYILIIATVVSFLSCLILLKKDNVMEKGTVRVSFINGMKHMVSASLLIILSRGLAGISEDLGTGIYITALFNNIITSHTLPALIALISALITIATGISWSSMAIIIPISYQMAAKMNALELIPVISGAAISGAIFGGLLIPYSDTSVMASSAFKITPVYHTKTQAFQILAVISISILGYLVIGYGINIWIVYLICMAVLTVLHYIFGR